MNEWIHYRDRRPDTAGVYEWRMENRAIGRAIRFFAHMRESHGIARKELSPSFDYWNGWARVVPEDTQWRAASDPPAIKEFAFGNLQIEGIENAPCPFCKAVPEWKAVEGDGRHTIVNSAPHRLNRWWLKCCKWADCEHGAPSRIAEERNSLLVQQRVCGCGIGPS